MIPRKVVSFVVIAALLSAWSLAAQPAARAASAATDGARVFRAGAATSNITPPLGISLDGYIAQGTPARNVHDELHARCLVLDDGQTRVALVIVDNTMVAREIFVEAKALAQKEIGFPANRILAAATHTHSTPRAVAISPSQQ